MEKLLLLVLIVSLGHSQEYFAGLNLDPVLVDQTNIAISTLKNSLFRNFDCSAQLPLLGPQPTVNLLGGARLLQLLSQSYQFKNFKGFEGYVATLPSIKCEASNFRRSVYQAIYQEVLEVTQLLQQVRDCLIQYNNIILGNNNTVVGDNNVVVGSSNSLNGSNDWVFASNYNAVEPTNGVLIIQSYLIELEDIALIPARPELAIKCIGQDQSNQQFNSYWTRSSIEHRFCF